ncbi:MAG: hypothetical protein RL021_2146 [Bacteroidota bacterium]|jgi:GT2 family glycosyltransferase
MSKAPIICFVYNRPDHTRRTLEALAACEGADDSTLYIFSDGARDDSAGADTKKVDEVRKLIRSIRWKGELIIRESATNKGLQASITEGITQVIGKHGKVIVTEDDILCGKHFLSYCNAALEKYERDEDVMHINGYMFPHRQASPDFFLSRYAMVWGWATWQRAWNRFSADASLHLQRLKDNHSEKEFDMYGAAGTLEMLIQQADGRLRTWDILWYASIFNSNGYCLTPSRSLTRNIGLDGSGAHFTSRISRKQFRAIDRKPHFGKFPPVTSLQEEQHLPVIEALREWNRPRLKDRITGKLSILWNQLLQGGKKSS